MYHEVPTHLDRPYRPLFRLTLMQCVVSGSVLLLAATLALSGPLPLALRLLCALLLVAPLAPALWWRPLGRGLDHWAAALVAYLARPRRAVWRPEGSSDVAVR